MAEKFGEAWSPMSVPDLAPDDDDDDVGLYFGISDFSDLRLYLQFKTNHSDVGLYPGISDSSDLRLDLEFETHKYSDVGLYLQVNKSVIRSAK